MAYTYEDLLNRLKKLPPDRLQDTVTVYNPPLDEFIGVSGTDICDEADNDVLDHNHLFLVLNY